jgi:hypothetical protein
MLHEGSDLCLEDIKGSRFVVSWKSWWFNLGRSGCRSSGGETVELSHEKADGFVVVALVVELK